MNRNLVAALAGCAVLLCVCCVAAGALVFVFDAPSKFNEISRSLGAEGGPIPNVVPSPLSGAGTRAGAASGSLSGNPCADAANKAKGATKYRLEFSWIFGGMGSGKYQETPFFDMKGEVDGKNSHLTSQGGLMAVLAAGQSTAIEIIEADGKTYMKGGSLPGMTDPKQWYITDDKSTSGFKDFAKPDEFCSFTGGKDADFKKVRTESLDGQSCDVWAYDLKSVQNAAIIGLLGSAKDKNDFSAIDKAEVDVWLCGDGLVHKYLVDYEGHDARDATQKGALRISAHMWDYNAAISVSAPAGTKPMPNSIPPGGGGVSAPAVK